MALLHLNYQSRYLNGNTDINVILPDLPAGMTPKEFYESGKKYPVVYLLHGTFGDYSDWVRKTNVEVYASERNVVVVMPSAANSGYANWDKFGIGYHMFDYLTEELMPLVQNWLPVSDKREDNFVAGLSSGGFGAIKYAFCYPEKFAGMASLSAPAYDVANMVLDPASPDYIRASNEIENAGGRERYDNSICNPAYSIREYAKTGQDMKVYFACGTNDFLMEMHKEFQQIAEEVQLNAKIETIEGYGHEWRFWDLTIEKAFDYFGLVKV